MADAYQVLVAVGYAIPSFLMSQEIAVRFRPKGASGAWVDDPHWAIGAATLYFVLLGLAEISLMTWIDPVRFAR